jgi:hypothetical protein
MRAPDRVPPSALARVAWNTAAARAATDAYVPPSALNPAPGQTPPWEPYAQRDIDHQRHSHEGLMAYVARVIDRQLRLSTEEISELSLRAKHGTEGERIEATKALVEEFRSQAEAYRKQDRARRNAIIDGRKARGGPVKINPLLVQAIDEFGRKIFAEADPVLALEILLGKKKSPGKHATNTIRDRDISRAVLDKMNGGMTMDKAVAAVAKDYRRSQERIKAIYLSGLVEAKAARHQI